MIRDYDVRIAMNNLIAAVNVLVSAIKLHSPVNEEECERLLQAAASIVNDKGDETK
jgi:hypothetical protein